MAMPSTVWRQAHEHRVMAWKNGLGETIEIARSPEGQALDGFDWRVSIAPVVSDGDFSVFAGIDRTIAVVEGAGMQLTLGTLTAPLRPGIPFTYDGGLAVYGRLVDGPVRDINLMVRRGRCTGTMMLVEGATAVAAAGAVIVAYVLSGCWRFDAGGEQRLRQVGESVVMAGAAALSLQPTDGPGRAALALVRPVEAGSGSGTD